MININSKAPDFKLFDTERKERSLTEFLGKKVVLVFFPGAFTGVCTKEMCALRDSLANFNSLNSQVVAISVDSPFSNKAFAETNKLTFPILSDYSRSIVIQYCGLQHDFAGLKGYNTAKRSVFILDKNGIVKYSWVSEDPGKEPPYDEITKSLNSF
jgi:glutaredoxin-dependent peroxiredoxin